MHVIFGLIFVVLGAYYSLEGFGIIPMYSKLLVEPWVLGCVGAFMFMLGLMLTAPEFFGGKSSGTASRSADGTLNIAANEQPGTLIGLWIFSIALSAFTVAFWHLLLTRSDHQSEPGLIFYAIIVLFTLMALKGLIQSIRLTISARRFGNVSLQLTGGRPFLGGQVAGHLDVPAKGKFIKAKARLKCQRIWKERGSGGKGSVIHEDTAWQSVHVMDIDRSQKRGRWRMAFAIDIPSQQNATSIHGGVIGLGELALGVDYYRWLLEVTGDIPGVDFVRSYFVPVDSKGTSTTPVVERGKAKAVYK